MQKAILEHADSRAHTLSVRMGLRHPARERANDVAREGATSQKILYNTLFSREDIFAKTEFEIFSREDIFANILFTRKYLPAKISSRENNFP